jgi:hypothetical protein
MPGQVDWGQLAAVVLVVGAVASVALALIRNRLARDFAPASAHAELAEGHRDLVEKVNGINVRIANIPTHHEVHDVLNRVAGVEAGMAGLQASVAAVSGQMVGIAKDVRMLVEHALEREGR